MNFSAVQEYAFAVDEEGLFVPRYLQHHISTYIYTVSKFTMLRGSGEDKNLRYPATPRVYNPK
jgi:hypothetical protein